MFRRADRRPRAADMRDLPGGLEEEEALLGRHPRQPALAGVAEHGGIVAGRIVAEEREMETVLPLQPPVTGAGIAAEPGQDRDDVLAEIPGPGRSRLDRHLRLGRRRSPAPVARHACSDRHDPRRHRPQIAPGLDRGQARRLRRPTDFGRPIAGRVRFVGRQELQTGIICRYRERLGRDPHGRLRGPDRPWRRPDSGTIGPVRFPPGQTGPGKRPDRHCPDSPRSGRALRSRSPAGTNDDGASSDLLSSK